MIASGERSVSGGITFSMRFGRFLTSPLLPVTSAESKGPTVTVNSGLIETSSLVSWLRLSVAPKPDSEPGFQVDSATVEFVTF